ncbi:MAG: hypothetical protein KJZ78_09355 [Bryobacteraceae bacterium]|nr:hypothetical protein [Bryobacteraceae bacterium]
MTDDAEPSITVNVDVTNPGQFFACCGLLELADRLWSRDEVAGGFGPCYFGRSQFKIFGKTRFTTQDLMRALLACRRSPVDPYQPIMGSNAKPVKDARKTQPIQLDGRIILRLAWWLDELAGRQTPFKMWGAHQTSEGLINNMAAAVNVDDVDDTTILESRTGMTGRIGLDTRSSWNTLDEGFSPNDQNLPVDTYPATELLAAIGLQTFSPLRHNDGYIYACWNHPLPTPVARAVASGTVMIRGVTRYRFEIEARGKFKYFTKASLLEGNTNG